TVRVHQVYGHLLPGLEGKEHVSHGLRTSHRLPSDGLDDVADFDPGHGCRAAGLHRCDQRTGPTGVADLSAKGRSAGVGDRATRDQLLGNQGDGVGGNGETDPWRRAATKLRVGRGKGRDADDLLTEINERPAGISGIYRRRGLDGTRERDV